jgi:hypothetical protein
MLLPTPKLCALQLVGLPILRPSTKQVAVANGETSTAKLPFKNVLAKATQADSFDEFPSSLMSVGKLSDDGTNK